MDIMKRKKFWAVICTILIVFGMFFQSKLLVAAATTEITLETDNYEINNEEEITVSVYLNSDTNIGAYHVEISYDSYRLEYISGGEELRDGKIILEGTGYGNAIVYKLKFKAFSGGLATISCDGADIRLEGAGNQDRQAISVNNSLNITISGEDTATRERNNDIYGIDSDIPVCGVVDMEDGGRYYIVDHSKYIPEIIDWEHSTVEDEYGNIDYTFMTNKGNEIRILYLMDANENFTMYAYSKEKECLYPCVEVISDEHKYYIMSSNVCINWPKELTLDLVKSENICYGLSADGTCSFYKYKDGVLTLWSEDDGRAFLDNQMKTFYIIMLVGLAIAVGLVVITILSNYKQKKRRLKKEEQRKLKNESVVVNDTVSENGYNDKYSKRSPVIAVKNVTMKFRISTSSASGIKEYFIQKLKKQVTYREFLALDNVSFNVYKGEVVGIIGTNGSGKSTLLRIVSGALNPTEGKVLVNKNKVQLLTLGTGFDMELTARENIYLNGAIIGYTKDFIDKNFDKIVAFAELQDFVDEKVKNFSSGMVSRLGFAIATVGEAAEILILDEVLSVGDEFFKKKSLKRIKEMIHGGSTVLMVSHGMGTILENCTKVVWIEKGKLKMVGEPKVVCDAYKNMNQ